MLFVEDFNELESAPAARVQKTDWQDKPCIVVCGLLLGLKVFQGFTITGFTGFRVNGLQTTTDHLKQALQWPTFVQDSSLCSPPP